MCLIFARILKLPTEHIIPEADPPKGKYTSHRTGSGLINLLGFELSHCLTFIHKPHHRALDGTPRPANTQLDVRETEALFEGSGFEGLGWSVFEDWWTEYLGRSEGSS